MSADLLDSAACRSLGFRSSRGDRGLRPACPDDVDQGLRRRGRVPCDRRAPGCRGPVCHQGRTGYAYTGDLSPEALDQRGRQAAQNAAVAEPDAFASLPGRPGRIPGSERALASRSADDARRAESGSGPRGRARALAARDRDGGGECLRRFGHAESRSCPAPEWRSTGSRPSATSTSRPTRGAETTCRRAWASRPAAIRTTWTPPRPGKRELSRRCAYWARRRARPDCTRWCSIGMWPPPCSASSPRP